ncbi:MAG: phosphodiester glycosidase family protein [Capsulimonas sp.]|uniref:phosphodiester glycosidase family protein n=1 Tax=Capsulimonas sp. TaxID=2494211 RepID=UPI003267500A
MFRRYLPIFAVLTLITLANSCVRAADTALIHTRIDGASVTYIAVNLTSPGVSMRPEVCTGFHGGDELFSSMVKRNRPIAAINGAYFDKITKYPIGDLVAEGKLIHSGRMGTALAIKTDGAPEMRRVDWGHAADWTGYRTVIACGPALVLDGKIDVNPELERFSDPHVMGSTSRMAIGYTSDMHLILAHIQTPVTFRREAQIMLSLGCVGAMNLDAGASLGMYYKGQFLATPSRRLTNIICIYERPKKP